MTSVECGELSQQEQPLLSPEGLFVQGIHHSLPPESKIYLLY